MSQRAQALGTHTERGSSLSLFTNAAEALGIAAIIFGIGVRAVGLPHVPLWIDETFTGAIASQPTFGAFLHMARADAPPSFLYYLFMHFWQMAFGLSDAALRFPSLCFSVAAPVLIAVSDVPGLTRLERLTWAGLLALWVPGIGLAQDARAYPLLLLMTTMQSLVFMGLIRTPSLRRAALWLVMAGLTIESNYDAIYLIIAEGAIFLALRKSDAVKTWPAALLLVPVCVEIAWKWPVLVRFEQPGTAWYHLLRPHDLLRVVLCPLGGMGGSAAAWLLLLPALCIGVCFFRGGRDSAETDQNVRILAWVAGAAILGCLTMVIVGFIRPTFTWRYMIAFEPGLLLGLVLFVRALSHRGPTSSLHGPADHWSDGVPGVALRRVRALGHRIADIEYRASIREPNAGRDSQSSLCLG